jgi:hypothetical protein
VDFSLCLAGCLLSVIIDSFHPISPNNIFPDRIKRRRRFDDSLDKLRLPANSGSTLTVLDSLGVFYFRSSIHAMIAHLFISKNRAI